MIFFLIISPLNASQRLPGICNCRALSVLKIRCNFRDQKRSHQYDSLQICCRVKCSMLLPELNDGMRQLPAQIRMLAQLFYPCSVDTDLTKNSGRALQPGPDLLKKWNPVMPRFLPPGRGNGNRPVFPGIAQSAKPDLLPIPGKIIQALVSAAFISIY